jgi:flavin-dependent dehydrogenase
LDARIVAEAVRRGCEFVAGAAATLLPDNGEEPFRLLRVRNGDETATIRAGVVLACDGIGGTLLAREKWAKWRVARNAWIGVAATCSAGPWEVEPGAIHMHVGNSGYVGMVRMGEGQVHLAAALSPTACRNVGGPDEMVIKILQQSRGSIAQNWNLPRIRGTAALTRRRHCLGGRRVLAIGDACGYVEPFTGEGMAWAAMGAREVVNMLPAPGEAWPMDLPQRWRRRYHDVIGRKQNWCRTMRPLMRSTAIAPTIISAANAFPGIVNWIAGRISQPGSKEMVNDAHVVIRSA